jgi:hypothetical protein
VSSASIPHSSSPCSANLQLPVRHALTLSFSKLVQPVFTSSTETCTNVSLQTFCACNSDHSYFLGCLKFDCNVSSFKI